MAIIETLEGKYPRFTGVGTGLESLTAEQVIADIGAAVVAPDFTTDHSLVRTDTVSGPRNVQQSAATLSDSGTLEIVAAGVSQITLTAPVAQIVFAGAASNIITGLKNLTMTPTNSIVSIIANGGRVLSTSWGANNEIDGGNPTIIVGDGLAPARTLEIKHSLTPGVVANMSLDGVFSALGALFGTSPSTLDTVDIDGTLRIDHTSVEADDHALEIDVDADGFGDVKAIDINYITGDKASGEDEAVILINIDETAATGGNVAAIEVLATEGGADKMVGLFVGAGIGPIEQLSGVFANMDSALNIAVDVLAAVSSGGAGNISMFVADNDTITIGDAAKFEELEFLLGTGSSGAGIAPIFEFSTGIGTWAAFTPVDGTNGFRNTGVVAWLDGDIPSWATGTGTEYLIRITRTRNSLTTTPIVDTVQIAAVTEYEWDKNGDILNRYLYMREQAAAGSDTAGLGQLWVKNDIPNTLWFTNDVGTDAQLSIVGHTHLEGDITDLQAYLLNITAESITHLSDVSAVTGSGTVVALQTAAVLHVPLIRDLGDNWNYSIIPSTLTATRNVTLPLLGANDEFVFKDHAVVLLDKTINGTTTTTFQIAGSDEMLLTAGELLLYLDGVDDTVFNWETNGRFGLKVGGVADAYYFYATDALAGGSIGWKCRAVDIGIESPATSDLDVIAAAELDLKIGASNVVEIDANNVIVNQDITHVEDVFGSKTNMHGVAVALGHKNYLNAGSRNPYSDKMGLLTGSEGSITKIMVSVDVTTHTTNGTCELEVHDNGVSITSSSSGSITATGNYSWGDTIYRGDVTFGDGRILGLYLNNGGGWEGEMTIIAYVEYIYNA